MKQIKEILASLSFLTILPIYSNEKDLINSIKYFPLTGLIIGLILGIVSLICFSVLIKAFFILFLWEFLTGFFHLDGVSDTCDAIFSSKFDRKVLFEIMNDSNIGVMGASCIFFILLGKYIGLVEILKMKKISVIILSPAVGRFSINFLSYKLNYAKENGLGKFICENNSKKDFLFSLIILIAEILIIKACLLLSFLLLIFILLFYSKYFNSKLGGVTGDIFGFAVETTELLFLFFAVIQLDIF